MEVLSNSLYVTLIMVGLLIIGMMVLFGALLMSAPKQDVSDKKSYQRKALLNSSEKKLLGDLDKVARDLFGHGARVVFQVSYGEFLKGEDRSAFASINQKRADFVIVNPNIDVLCVVEYQGAGHYGRGEAARANAIKRDQIKREACESAGIAFVEIPNKFTRESVARLVAEKCGLSES
jgi:hypothetical protein